MTNNPASFKCFSRIDVVMKSHPGDIFNVLILQKPDVTVLSGRFCLIYAKYNFI